jgi:4-alpha-glucanotransferase
MDQNTTHEDLVNELSGICGILPEYWDIFGKKHLTTLNAREAMLRAFRLNIDSDDDIRREIEDRRNREWKGFIEPVFVVSVNKQLIIPVHIPVEAGQEKNLVISCSYESENGAISRSNLPVQESSVAEVRTIEGTRYIKVLFTDDAQTDIGYYTVRVECRLHNGGFPDGNDSISKASRLIVTPDFCYIPDELQEGKMWGLSLNLYSIHSESSWGIGDFGDLKSMISIIAPAKAHFVGVNPLHAIPNTHPYGISPYSPISRIYKNFIYLDIKDIPEIRDSDGLSKSLSQQTLRNNIRRLQEAEKIDYEQVSLLKEQVLRDAFEIFYEKEYGKDTDRDRNFRSFLDRQAGSLEDFAAFQALSGLFKKTINAYSWQEWPEEFHDPHGEEVRAFKDRNRKELLFYQYLQWLIDEQLLDACRFCGEKGMSIGLYHDLAVGAVAGGSDVWSNQDIIGDADVGAPPDEFNPKGQNWGFPPVIPEKLRENGYKFFIETIGKNMKYGGALRIDHALGLYRLFWIPAGMSPENGAYLLQPAEDFLRIIALESHRNKTLVIAEDLGTIDDTFREMLQAFQMLSYRLFYFERNYPDPSFKVPQDYPSMALCAITTHDLPTIYGYWAGRDIDVKKQLGIYKDEEAWRNDLAARERDKALLLSALKSAGTIPGDFPENPREVPEMTYELCMSIYRYLARSRSKLLLVSLDDIVGTLDQQNMPGTVDSHPNWMQKSPDSLEEMAGDSRLSGLRVLER